MEITTVSSEFQIVIPENIRQRLKIQPGQRVGVIQYDDRIELILLRPIKEMRGFLKGIDTRIERLADRY